MPAEVFAFVKTSRAHAMECEDVVAAVLRFADGCVGTFNATTAACPGFAERVELGGTLATAVLCAGRLDVRYLDGRRESVGIMESLGTGADPMAFSLGAHRAVVEDFLQAVAQGMPPAIDGASVVRTRRFIDALLASEHTASAVQLAGQAP